MDIWWYIRTNIGLKYEIVRNIKIAFFNLWHYRIIKMKLIDVKCFRDDGTFILFECIPGP